MIVVVLGTEAKELFVLVVFKEEFIVAFFVFVLWDGRGFYEAFCLFFWKAVGMTVFTVVQASCDDGSVDIAVDVAYDDFGVYSRNKLCSVAVSTK